MEQMERGEAVSWLGLAFWLGLSLAAGWVGSNFQPGSGIRTW